MSDLNSTGPENEALIQSFPACRLCHLERPLLQSHILPAFVFRWQRESSGNGHIRRSDNPNTRVQDGIKRPLFCSECEQRFSKDEQAFASRIFYPYLEKPENHYHYGSWLLRFCTSVSWRVLRFAFEEEKFADATSDQLERLRAADSTWREFLLGRTSHPGEFRQHILPLDMIVNASGAEAPNINRYLMRAIHLDICRSHQSIFTFSKLGRFLIFGMIKKPSSEIWEGTRINSNHGHIGPRKYTLPRALWTYLNANALTAAKSMTEISERQQEKIAESFRRNIDRLAASDAFAAMDADVRVFGEAAFTPQRPNN